MVKFWRRKADLALGCLILAACAAPLVVRDPFILHVLLMSWLYGLLGQAWNVLGGYGGQISLGQTVYFGLGAYSSTYLGLRAGLCPWLGMLVGVALSVILALAVGYPCFRLRGKYFVIASIALLQVAQTAVTNIGFLGGACGLSVPIRPEGLLNMQFHTTKVPYYYLTLVFFVIGCGIVSFLERSWLGYYFRAMAEGEEAAESLGVDTTRYKLLAGSLSAGLCAIAGTLYAQYVLFIDPGSALSYPMAIKMCLLVIMGGSGTVWGPVIGAAVLVPLSEASRAFWGGGGRGVDLIVYGVLLVALTVVEPRGIVGMVRSRKRKALMESR